MPTPKAVNIRNFIKPYVVVSGKKFILKDHDPGDMHHLNSEDKPEAKRLVEESVRMLAELQEVLYAQSSWGLLLIFQAMDAAGKDSTIRHVMSGVNPQGVDVFPSSLLRVRRCRTTFSGVPIGACLHEEKSESSTVLTMKRSWWCGCTRNCSRTSASPRNYAGNTSGGTGSKISKPLNTTSRGNGIAILKFFLNVSKKEQKRRFLERLEDPRKHWKFSAADIRERERWDDYQDAYEKMIRNTASEYAPWVVVPADNKWFTRLVVVATIVDALTSLDLEYPKLNDKQFKELAAARKQLQKE